MNPPRYYMRCHESQGSREAWTIYDRHRIEPPLPFSGFRSRYVARPELDRLNALERVWRV